MRRSWTLFFIVVTGLYKGASIAKECTSPGAFPNDQENSCVGYTLCLTARAGNFSQLSLTCPDGFIFNHYRRQCTNVTGYQCDPSYNCTHVGEYPNPNNDNCNSFITCVEGFNEVITARLVDCPESSTFNPDMRSCVNETEFQCNSPKEIVPTENGPTFLEPTENSAYIYSLQCSIFFTFFFVILIL